MCEPASITALTTAVTSAATAAAPYISTATALASFAQTSQMASRQEKALQQSHNQQMNQVALQQQQINQQATEKMSERALEAQREASRLSVIAGESGTMGGSNDRVVNEAAFNASHDIATIEANRLNTQGQITAEAQGIAARTQSSLNSIKRPSLIGTGLQIAGGFVDAGTRRERNRAPTVHE